MTEWISVEDRLPEEGRDGLEDGIEDVLICYKRVCERCAHADGEHICVGYYMREWHLAQPLSDDVFTEEHHNQIEVTHWMPLPEPPK